MGRPLESPWGVRWIDGQSFRHASLFHGDRRILRGLPPHNMLPVVEAAGIATTDLRHLLVWASWIVTAFYASGRHGRSVPDEDTCAMWSRKACSLLRPSPGCSFDFGTFWGWGLTDGSPMLSYAAVADLSPPPAEEVVDDGMTLARPECLRDLLGFMASQ